MSSECYETGSVVELKQGNKVIVEVNRGEACGACAAKGACQTLGGGTSAKAVFFEMINDVSAKKGDRVKISMLESAVFKASFVLYLIPALFVLFGAFMGSRVAVAPEGDHDAYVLIGSLGGLIAGFFATYLAGKKLSGHSSMQPKIDSIVYEKSDNPG
ncbi:MAG: SoxR reducing system RseC family protein [Deltaproteobacteria bacterium]|nr:SoxR reducing system RseC family protein [Deltaproteobacteria bacterium]